jgi:3-hydroxybutyryl-CoA dehydrogenase
MTIVSTIEKVAVVGAGYMGGGIAQSLAKEGYDVVLADVSAQAAQTSLQRLLREAREYEDQGLFGPGSADAVAAHLSAAPSIEDAVAGVDFVHEAVFEKIEVKHEVLARISAAARPEAIIGTNTSTIPVHVLAPAVTGPERFLTVHWSNPAPFIPGVELVTGVATDPGCIGVVKAMLARAGRRSAQVADTPGFVLNRLQYTLFKEAAAIVAEGVATAEDVDTIVSTTFGFRLPFFGPFAIADMAGLDVYVFGMKIMQEAYGERMAPPPNLTELVDAGHHGAKTGTGFTLHGDPSALERMITYRNTAYARQNQLLAELGGPLAEQEADR